MYHTSIVSEGNPEEILDFLERRGLVENAWLIGRVAAALRKPEAWEPVAICRSGEELVGVAHIFHQNRVPAEYTAPAYVPKYDYRVRMEAVDRPAVEALIETLPADDLGDFWLFRPMIQEYLNKLPGAARREGDLYFTVSSHRFRPVAGEEVVELTAADAALFEGCERQYDWEHMGEEHRVFAILRSGGVASSTGVGPVTPTVAMERRVVAISGLHTETPYRRLGLGRRLASYVTETILQDGHAPMYWTEPENTASQGLAKSLGYWQFAQEIRFLWRKSGSP